MLSPIKLLQEMEQFIGDDRCVLDMGVDWMVTDNAVFLNLRSVTQRSCRGWRRLCWHSSVHCPVRRAVFWHSLSFPVVPFR